MKKNKLAYNVNNRYIEEFVAIIANTGITCNIKNAMYEINIVDGNPGRNTLGEIDRTIIVITYNSKEDMILNKILLQNFELIEM